MGHFKRQEKPDGRQKRKQGYSQVAEADAEMPENRGFLRRLRLDKPHSKSDLLWGVIFTAGCAFLFYRSFWGLLCGVAVIPFAISIRRENRRQIRQADISGEFQTGISAVADAAAAGRSMEQAFLEAQKELVRMYGKDAACTQAFAKINQRVRMNEALEMPLMEFAYETGIPDLIHFAEIFRYAKRNGGNVTEIIGHAIRQMNARNAVREDIKTAVTARQTEQRMLTFLVPGILLFVTVTSPEYVQVLYHSVLGAGFMSGCLAVYLAAVWWSRKITAIDV